MKAFGIQSTAGRRRRHWHKPWYDRGRRYHRGYWYWGR
jgi:hypothetical protein